MKYDFYQVLDAINSDVRMHSESVYAHVLRRVVWVAEWHIPGCLSESFSVYATKAEAIECALMYADNPRGMKTALNKYGRFDTHSGLYGTCVNTVYKTTVSDFVR